MEELNEIKKVKNALWEIINYSNLFVVVLDEEMNIRLINYCLSKALGFETENEPVGRCWLDFIEQDKHPILKSIHRRVIDNDLKFNEVITELLVHHETPIPVKWFNSPINHQYKWTFSVGVPLITGVTPDDSADSIRAYFRDIIQRDRTMIESLRDVALDDPKPF